MPEPSSSFKVVQVCSVSPPPQNGTTTTTTSSSISMPLSFFDIIWLRFPPVERLFFYKFPNYPSSNNSFYDSILPNLKHSLSLTLQHFLPLIGNIIWPSDSPKPVIRYVPNQDSVTLTIAESNDNDDGAKVFEQLCSNSCEASQRYFLVPQLAISHEKASLLALQVTLFPKFGFCIGISTHHAAMDGKSSTMFMKAWSYTCSKLLESPSFPSSSLPLPENLTPFLDRSLIKDPTKIGESYGDSWLNHGGTNNNRSLKVFDFPNEFAKEGYGVKALFELSPTQIMKLKEHAKSKMGGRGTKSVKLSTFSVTCAYVLSCLVRTEEQQLLENVVKKVLLIFSVDCRTRLDPPIVSTYFGNCIAGERVEAETKGLLLGNIVNDGFMVALEAIIEGLKRVEDGSVMNGAETWLSDIMFSFVEGGKIYSIAGSPRFGVYDVDFGYGRPEKVDMTSTDKTRAFSLSENKDNNGGIEIGLAMEKSDMEAFSSFFHEGLQSL
ncbi:hypothetical protein PIB30_046437 [Stylosanthes scabra]|uniref:Uncharacterized protein n=1 Tax=Stylosanthes scabra TaxID=79078 RepID=A0ABU6XEV4_9FABA|nr:hypothetical protein [Stylosanthes scabra]